jgi:hypothetical protein
MTKGYQKTFETLSNRIVRCWLCPRHVDPISVTMRSKRPCRIASTNCIGMRVSGPTNKQAMSLIGSKRNEHMVANKAATCNTIKKLPCAIRMTYCCYN